MQAGRMARRVAAVLGGGVALAAGGYAVIAGTTWARYGRPAAPTGRERDPLLDTYMPEYEVADRHCIYVPAPADIVFAAAMDVNLQKSAVVRAIFAGREWAMGGHHSESLPVSLVAQTKALGWGVLAEVPDREIVMGAITQPWKADVIFHALPPEDFAAFAEPGYVKIVWTLRADPVDGERTVARTETRVACTSSSARRAFRRYWSFVSPGVVLIRLLALRLVKSDAERRFAEKR